MTYRLSATIVLTMCVFVSAQQPRGATPQGGTPPTFPADTAAPKPSETPDQEKPPRALTSQETKIQIVKKLQTEPGLASENIKVEVTNDKVVLSGSVPTQNERAVAQRIAQSYAGTKRVENRLVIATDGNTNTPEDDR